MNRKVTEADLVVGAKLLSQAGCTYNVVAGPDTQMCYVIQRPFGEFIIVFRDALMAYEVAPLCAVEGKPVYKGDKLYDPNGKCREIHHVRDGCLYGLHDPGYDIADWSWEPPCEEITGWVAVGARRSLVTAIADTTCVYPTREEVERVAPNGWVIQQITVKVGK